MQTRNSPAPIAIPAISAAESRLSRAGKAEADGVGDIVAVTDSEGITSDIEAVGEEVRVEERVVLRVRVSVPLLVELRDPVCEAVLERVID